MDLGEEFFPQNSSFTRADVIEMIEERRSEDAHGEFGSVGQPDVAKMTDEAMQRFVNAWDDKAQEAFESEYPNIGNICYEQDQILLAFAREIQKS